MSKDEVIRRLSIIVHATITHDEPLLALFAWTNDPEIAA